MYSLSNYIEPRGGGAPVGQKPRELMTPEELAEAGYSGAGEDLMEADFEIDYPPSYPFGKNVAADLKYVSIVTISFFYLSSVKDSRAWL